MHLNANQASDGAVVCIIVQDDAHESTIDDVRQRVTSNDEVNRIPAAGQNASHVFGVAKGGQNDRLVPADHMRHLPAQGKKEPPLLFVVLAGVDIATIDVALVAAHGELIGWCYFVGHHCAAVVDAAVAASSDPVVHLEFEVLGRPTAPDDEGVALDDGLGSDLANQRAILGAPVPGVALPAVERLSVKDRSEARLVRC